MTEHCTDLQAFVDGELSAEEAGVFRDHLGECDRCAADLGDAMQFTALSNEWRATVPTPMQPPGARPRWWKHTLALSMTAMAAAAVWILMPGAPSTFLHPDASKRHIEYRLSYSPAAGHRPYAVQRAATNTTAGPSLHALAQLEKDGDHHGLGAAYLLRGNLSAANEALLAAGPGADVLNDRAVVALAQGKPHAALTFLDAVLEDNPQHPMARWNHALALRDMGLPMGAAAELLRLADAADSAAWRAEAEARGKALHQTTSARIADYTDIYSRGRAAVQGGIPLTAEQVRRAPGIARLLLYDALRAAPSPERAAELLPWAKAVDTLSQGNHLQRYQQRVAQANFDKRSALARTYGTLVAGRAMSHEQGQGFLAALRHARADDILLGAHLFTTETPDLMSADVWPEYNRLARQTGDPWFALLADEQHATRLIAEGDIQAETILHAALARCSEQSTAYRCLRLQARLADYYFERLRLGAAKEAAELAWRQARRSGDVFDESRLLWRLGEISRFADDIASVNAASATAYLEEVHLRQPDSCHYTVAVFEALAALQAGRLRVDVARRHWQTMETARKDCGETDPTISQIFVHAQLEPLSPSERQTIIEQTQTIRAGAQASLSDRAMAYFIDGKVSLSHDRPAGLQALRRAIALGDQATGDINAAKARHYSFARLAVDAGEHGATAEVMALVAEEIGLPTPDRCAVAMAAESSVVIAVRDADGAWHADQYPFRLGDWNRERLLMRPALYATLEDCASVDVLVRPPFYGQAKLLPESLAWRFLSGRGGQAAGEQQERTLVIADVLPPAHLRLPRLRPWPNDEGLELLSGASATPRRVIAAMRTASYIEIHAHGISQPGIPGASFLVVSPDSAGHYTLRGDSLPPNALTAAPVVVLGACTAGQAGRALHQPGGLPSAFLAAGARTVIASPAPIGDQDASLFFRRLRHAIQGGEDAAFALRRVRQAWPAAAAADHWSHHVVVFE